MLRRNDPPAFDRIIVQVIDLLPHDLIAHDSLRMRSLLPDLVSIGLVFAAVELELVQKPIAPFGLELLHDLAGGETLDGLQDTGQIGRGEDRMEVIVHNDPRVDFESLVLAIVF